MDVGVSEVYFERSMYLAQLDYAYLWPTSERREFFPGLGTRYNGGLQTQFSVLSSQFKKIINMPTDKLIILSDDHVTGA